MTYLVEYLCNRASYAEIAEHLLRCDGDFVPRLSDRVSISDYAKKISSLAIRFEAWSGDRLIGLVAGYYNDPERHTAYITSVSVLKGWAGNGIGARLMDECIEYSKGMGLYQIKLEVAGDNLGAIRLYSKKGFLVDTESGSVVSMELHLHSNYGDEG